MSFKNILRALRIKKGFTLMETVVALMLLVFFMAAISAVLPLVLKQFNNARSLAEMNGFMNNIADEITNDLLKATSVSYSADTLTINTNATAIKYKTDGDGVLKRDYGEGDVNVLPVAYYHNKTKEVSVTYDEVSAGAGVYVIGVTIVDNKNNTSLFREYYVKPLAIGQNQYY